MVGMILGNRYEIIKEIGTGGMSNVYLAHCRLLNRDVAVKIPKAEFASDKEFLDRFIMEAQAAAAITCPNIVGVYDVGKDNDINYIVMEYVEGQTLKEYIDKNGMLSWQQTVNYSIQICKALESAHKHGIIHRDIKPQNIIITNDGILKVTDFGIARAASSETVKMDESTMGSVHYFSPEQARGGYTDAKSDIYSLGVVMYEMITGHLPYDGDSPIAIAIKHIQGTPVNPKEYNIAIPLAVESIIKKAMARELRLRYQSAEEMLSDLYNANKNPDEIPITGMLKGDNVKYKAIDDFNIDGAVKNDNNPHENQVQHRPVKQSTNKKKTKKDKKEQGSVKKAVLLAVVTAFAILGIITILGFTILGGCGREIEIPNLVGEMYDDVIEKYKDEDFTITIEQYVEDSKHEAGYILSQTPEGGKATRSLKDIKVKVVKDQDSFIIGDFEGKTLKEMKEALAEEIKTYKIKFKEIEEDSTEIEKNKVMRTYPSAGSKVKKGETISVYISSGGEKMPDLIGCTLEVAKQQVERLGLSVGKVTPAETDGTYVVIYQSIDPDTVVEKGKKVDFELKKADVSPNSGTGSTPDNSGNTASVTSKVITVILPQDKDVVNVRVVQDGKVIHNQTHNKGEGSVDITVKGTGTSYVDIYFDGTYNNTVTVTL